MSRLYPGWGTGKQVFEESFQAYSLACLGRDDMEAGDKIIMSQSTFRKVSRLKLPFPLMFQVTNPRIAKAAASKQSMNSRTSGLSANNTKKKSITAIPDGSKNGAGPVDKEGKKKRPAPIQQFCGVLEFSGPEEKVFMPHWMMQNLRVKEGQKVDMKTIQNASIPKGTLCRLQPHTTAFIDLAATMDLRELLEHAFRNYSVLSQGETIVVSIADMYYKIDVVETQPGPAISLYGNLDLEVDFAPPLDSPDVGKMRPGSREKKTGDDDEHSRPSHSNAQVPYVSTGAPGLVGNNVLSFQQAMADKRNQEPSPKKKEEPAGHVWGRGQSLNGDFVCDGNKTVSDAGNPTETGPSNTTNIPRRAKRRPSKFASRTGGTSFLGDGTALAAEEDSSAGSSAANSASGGSGLSVFAGEGRTLQGGASNSTTPKASSAPDRNALRERRLKFLENLEKQRLEAEEGDESSPLPSSRVAVGSSLNAIRKTKK